MHTSTSNLDQDLNIKIASITSANGIKGYVKLILFLERPDDIEGFLDIYDQNGQIYILRPISKKPNYWIIAIEGVNSRNEAEDLRGTDLFIKKSSLPKLDDNQYYYQDLLDMDVKDVDGTEIGKIVNVQNFGAGDMLEIQLKKDNALIYYPFSNTYVIEVRNQERVVIIIGLDIFL